MHGPEAAIARMRSLIYGNWQACITYAFAELNLADLIGDGSRDVAELAAATETDARSLYRFLRCCAQLQFVRFAADGARVDLTEFGALLQSDHPCSQRDAARLNGAFYRYEPWGRIVDVLRAGSGAAVSPAHRDGSLEFLRDKPDLLKVFQGAMTDLSVTENRAIAQAYEFDRFRHVVDVGGGHGAFIRTVLEMNPDLRGTLFDLARTLDSGARDGGSVDGRLDFVAGDFFQPVPPLGDLFTLKNVLHNWPEDKVQAILRNLRAALPEQGGGPERVLVIEHVMADDDNAQSVAPWLDMNLFILVGGQDRTLGEYRALFAQCGFVIDRQIPTSTGRSILELQAIAT